LSDSAFQVKATADKLQAATDADARERTLLDTKATVLAEERERLAGALREKEHAVELLTMDKTYLSNQAKILADQVGSLARG
jgi:septal ring factor EnvC (AmiA/AmiB activator)